MSVECHELWYGGLELYNSRPPYHNSVHEASVTIYIVTLASCTDFSPFSEERRRKYAYIIVG